MDVKTFGPSLLRTAGRVVLLAALAGSVACGGCDDEPTNGQTDTGNNNNNNNNDMGPEPDGANNIDNMIDPGMITVAPETLTINENGGTGTFTVTLAVEPSMGDVVINLVSGDESEATVSPAQLTLGAGTMSGTVTVTGVDDADLDGPQTISIATNVVGQGNYLGVDAADVSVTVNDDDAAGGSVTPQALTITEAPNLTPTATFDVVLGAMPSGDVTIPISVSDDTEMTVDVASLTFTAANFSTPQTVTVSAIDDLEVEPPQQLSVVIGLASGGGYDTVDLPDVAVTVVDDDMATISVSPTILATSETGTTATFTVTLGTTPTADVVINANVTDATEGSIAPASVTLNGTTLSGTFTVTGLDDTIQDGAVTYAIDLTATSGDAAFDGLTIPSVAVTNADDDNAGVLVTPTNLTVNEQGATSATFTIALSSDPGEPVTIDIASSDATQATVAPASLAFDSTNFATPQTVTVTAVDDAEVDGNAAVVITTTMNATMAYATVDPADVNVLVVDNDSANILVNPLTGLTTSEAGGSDTFTIVLTSQPAANVTVNLVSSDTTEGTVSPASVTFTAGTWQTAQTVTVTGVDDLTDDGSVFYNINTSVTSTDTVYGALDPGDPLVQNTDDDTAGFIVNIVGPTVQDGATLRLLTTERTLPAAPTTATFTVALTTPPVADVTLPIQVTDSTEGSVSPQTLTFTDMDWNTPQVVTVSSVDDTLPDGPVNYNVILDTTTSADTAYNNLDPPNVPAQNRDNEPGITVTPNSLPGTSIAEAAPGNTLSVSVVLNSQPNQNIQVDVTNVVGLTTDYTLSNTFFVFTPANWATPRTLTVTGVPDMVAEGAAVPWQFIVAISDQININGNLDPEYLQCQTDANTPNVQNGTGPCRQVVNGQTTDSNSTTAAIAPTEFDVIEDSCEQVTVTLSTVSGCAAGLNFTVGPVAGGSDLGIANIDGGATLTSRSYSIASGATTASFWVCADDDILPENPLTEAIPVSALTCATTTNPYHNVDLTDLSVTTIDNDQPGIIIDSEAVAFNMAVTTELGNDTNWDQFDISLATPPSIGTQVLVTVTSTDPTEGLLQDTNNAITGASISFLFGPNDWSSTQEFRVIGQDDMLLDGAIEYSLTITTQSMDPFYNGLSIPNIRAVNVDNDLPGWSTITNEVPTEVSEADLALSTRWLVFANTNVSQPVNVTVSTSDDTEVGFCAGGPATTCPNPGNDSLNVLFNGTVAGGDFCFGGQPPCAIWFSATGRADGQVDGNQQWAVSGAINTTDPNYNVTTFPTINGTTIDIDQASVIVNCNDTDLDEPNPAADSTLCNVSLTSEPSADVVLAIQSSDTGEATVSPSSITLDDQNYQGGINITVTSVTDDSDDGDQQVTISATGASTDPDYNGLVGTEVIEIDDVDSGEVLITNVSLTTSEDGSIVGQLDVVLSTQPTADVTIPVYSFDVTEGTVSVAQLVFTPANWNTPQTIFVNGVQDTVNDGPVDYDVCLDIPTSADVNYDGDPFQCRTLTNLDDDFVGISVIQPQNPAHLITDEGGATSTFQVVLNAQPESTCGVGNNQSCTVEVQVGKPDGSTGFCDSADTDCYAFAYESTSTNPAGNDEIARANPHTLLFDATNWNVPQTVTVQGMPNGGTSGVVNGVRWYQMPVVLDTAGTDDPEYLDHYDSGTGTCPAAVECYTVNDVLGAHVDNETQDLVVFGYPLARVGGGSALNVVPGIITGESGGQYQFWVRAAQQPEQDVNLAFSSSIMPINAPGNFIIHGGNFNQNNALTISGGDDGITFQPAGFTPHNFTITATSDDDDYDIVRVVTGFHVDNDSCAITSIPATTGGSRADTLSGRVTPFVLVSGAAPTLVLPVGLTFGGNALETFTGVSINAGQQARSLQLFTSGGNGDILFEVNPGADTCYLNAADESFFVENAPAP